jgi:hypothetical protein
MLLVISNSRNGSGSRDACNFRDISECSAGELATGWTTATAEKPRKHGRQPKKRRRNSSNNKDKNIVIGVF